MDDVFDSFFENLLGQFIEDQFEANMQLEKTVQDIEIEMHERLNLTSKLKNDLEIVDEPRHQDHITVTGVKDVTKENQTKEKEIPKETIKETIKESIKEKIQDTKKVNKPQLEEEHPVAISHESGASGSKTDRIMTAKEKKKQIKDEKKRQGFVKICKFVFYLIILFTLYVVVRRLLVLVGLIEDSKPQNVAQSTTVHFQGVEMKSANTKNE